MKNKKGGIELTFSPFAYIVLGIVFAGFLAYHVSSASAGILVYEQNYAKQVALLIDEAKPDMQILVDFEEGIGVAKKNKRGSDLVGVDSKTNQVWVNLGSERSYSYKYFSDYDVNVYDDVKKNLIIINIGDKVWSEVIVDFDKEVSEGELKKSIKGSGCESYSELISKYAKQYDVNSVLVLALMMQESSCNELAVSLDESSYGLMQINTVFERQDNHKKVGHCGDYGLSENVEDCRKELMNPKINIPVGIQILKKGYNENPKEFECENVFYSGWERALRNYVGWGCDDFHKNYVEEVKDKFALLEGGDLNVA